MVYSATLILSILLLAKKTIQMVTLIYTASLFFMIGFTSAILLILTLTAIILICRAQGTLSRFWNTYPNPQPQLPDKYKHPTPKNRGFRDIVEESTSAEDFIEKIKKTYPYKWATKLKFLEYAAATLHPAPV
ncbi:hypothetical protein Pfo_009083, partial [Paulownia fortunei]